MSYLRGPLTKEQVARLTQRAPTGPAPSACAEPAASPTPPPPRSSPPTRRPSPRASHGDARLVPRPGRAVGVAVGAVAGSTRLRAFLAARVSLRYDDSAAGVDEQQEFEAVYGPLDGGLDLASETQVDYDDRDFSAAAPASAAYVLPTAPARRGAVLHADGEGDPAAPRRPPPARAPAQPRAQARLAPRRDAGGVRSPLRRRGAGAGRRGDGEDPRPARGEARPAREGARAGAAARRGARDGHALPQRDGADRRRRRRARRALRRPPQHALDRERDRRRRLAPRRRPRGPPSASGAPRRRRTRRGTTSPSSSRRSSTRSPRSTSAGTRPPTRSTRSRSGSRRRTCACSRRGRVGAERLTIRAVARRRSSHWPPRGARGDATDAGRSVDGRRRDGRVGQRRRHADARGRREGAARPDRRARAPDGLLRPRRAPRADRPDAQGDARDARPRPRARRSRPARPPAALRLRRRSGTSTSSSSDAGRRRRTTSASERGGFADELDDAVERGARPRGAATGARAPAPSSTRASARSPGLPETAQRQGTSGDA